MPIIYCNGESLETNHVFDLSDEEYIQLKAQLMEKPDFWQVEQQMKYIDCGSIKNNLITNYYVKDLMYKTKIYYNKWSLEEVINSKELLGHFVSKTMDNKLVFPDNMSLSEKVDVAFRLSGKGVASKPANFPIKTVDEILTRYNVNNNYYDYSCGWGARLTSALKNKVNYFGTDPNYLLTDRLMHLADDYRRICHSKTQVDIRTQGSETFVPQWENTIGLAFSSPPYFYLEDYKVGEQSWKTGVSYGDWKSNYLSGTIANIRRYLVLDGFFVININNFLDFDLVGDTKKIAESLGFVYIGDHKLQNISRISSKAELNDNDEKIMVFMKKESDKIEDAKNQISYGYNRSKHHAELSLF